MFRLKKHYRLPNRQNQSWWCKQPSLPKTLFTICSFRVCVCVFTLLTTIHHSPSTIHYSPSSVQIFHIYGNFSLAPNHNVLFCHELTVAGCWLYMKEWGNQFGIFHPHFPFFLLKCIGVNMHLTKEYVPLFIYMDLY